MKKIEKKFGGGGVQLDIIDKHDLMVVFSEKRSNGLRRWHVYHILTFFIKHNRKLTEGTTLVNGEILKGPNWDSLKLRDQNETQK